MINQNKLFLSRLWRKEGVWKMAKKDGMYFYNDWLTPFEKLDRSEVGDLVIAMMRYFIKGEEPPEFQGLAGMAADFIFPQIDRSMEYARLGSRGGIATMQKSRSSGKESPCAEKKDITVQKEPVIEPKEPKEPTEPEPFELQPVEYFSEEEALPPARKVDEKPQENYATVEQRMFEEMVREDRFNKFWRNYPKKAGKQEAKLAFEKLSPDDGLLKRMISALEKQKETQMWKKEEGRFIPYPARWLEGKRWEDEEGTQVADTSREQTFDTDDFFEAALRRVYDN